MCSKEERRGKLAEKGERGEEKWGWEEPWFSFLKGEGNNFLVMFFRQFLCSIVVLSHTQNTRTRSEWVKYLRERGGETMFH